MFGSKLEVCIISKPSSPIPKPVTKTISTVDIRGHFGRNGFLMDATTTNIKFYAKEDISLDTLSEVLTIRSYKNSLLKE